MQIEYKCQISINLFFPGKQMEAKSNSKKKQKNLLQPHLDRILRLVDWFIPVKARENVDTLRMARMIVGYCLMCFIIYPPYGGLYLLYGNIPGAIGLFSGILAAIIILPLMKYIGQVHIGVILGMLTTWMILVCVTVTTGGLSSNVIGWLTLIPLGLILIMGVKYGLFGALLIGMTMIVLYVLELKGLILKSFIDPGMYRDFQLAGIFGLPITVWAIGAIFQFEKNRAFVLLNRKKKDIQNMLEHVPQGIMTVLKDQTIHHEYSTYLETIFHTTQVGGENVINFLFSQSDLDADTLDQIKTTIRISIGEDMMNFALNSHLLPDHFQITCQDELKHLDLTWSPICDSNGAISQILISIRDVTKLISLQEESKKQNRELEIIRQILSVKQEDFHHFMTSSIDFLDTNQGIIEATKSKDFDTLNILFRNMHTIKGNARTYGLLHLTNAVHEAENEYSSLRKDESRNWSKELLLEQLSKVRELVVEYDSVNRNKLGRKQPGRRLKDEYHLIKKAEVEQFLTQLGTVDNNDLLPLKKEVFRFQNVLERLGTDKLEIAIAGILESVSSLADELNKPSPEISIENNNVFIKNDCFGLLTNVFSHVIRNSLDHGIESPEERKSLGKERNGKISVSTEIKNDKLVINYRDDGRGINILEVRKKAVELGLIDADDAKSAVETAKFIFHSGLSTAGKTTEISGRGVGMEAVQKFFEKMEGSIAIHLLDEANDTFIPFELIMTLPASMAVLQVESNR